MPFVASVLVQNHDYLGGKPRGVFAEYVGPLDINK